MKRRGYAIPLCILVSAVTLMLAVSALALSQEDLRLAQATVWGERALQVAHFGLECGVRQGGFKKVSGRPNVYAATYRWNAGALPGDEVAVTAYDNSAAAALAPDSGCPVEVPRGFLYWVAEGKAVESGTVRAQRRVGALVQMGVPLGSGGAQVSYLRRGSESGGGSAAPQAWTFHITDPSGEQSTDQVIFATDKLTSDALHLGRVADLSGKIRLGASAADDTATADGFALPSPLRDGGAFNVTPYNPPLLANRGSKVVDAPGEALPAGDYPTLTLHAQAQLEAGTYHVGHLFLQTNDSSGLRGPAVGNVKLMVDQVSDESGRSNGRLALDSQGNLAQRFKFTLGPVAGGEDGDDITGSAGGPPSGTHAIGAVDISFELRTNGGPVQVVAPGRRIKARPNLDNEIKGSFMCKELTLLDGPAGASPVFIGDTSANSARRDGDSPGSMDYPVMPSLTSGGEGEPSKSQFTGTEPFILSRSVF